MSEATIPSTSIITRSQDVPRALLDARTSLTRGWPTALGEMSLDEVADVHWPTAQGWTVRSVEAAWFDVLYVVDHPTHGVGVSLFSVQPRVARIGDVDTTLDEKWAALDPARRRQLMDAATHAHGTTALDVLTLFVDPDVTPRSTTWLLTLFGCLLDSDTFSGDSVRTLVALNPAFESILAQTRARVQRQAQMLGASMFLPTSLADG